MPKRVVVVGGGGTGDYTAFTLGARGSYQLKSELFGREQSIELGYYGRFDHTSPEIQRLRFGTQIPYLIDTSLTTDVLNLAPYVDQVYGSPDTVNGLTSILGTVFFAFQIYGDFAGYSLIAIGMGRIMGVDFGRNCACWSFPLAAVSAAW